MSAIDDILQQLPLGQLAGQVGASQADTATAASQVITSLLGGMSANVADGGADALAAALQQHAPTTKPGKATKTTAAKAKTGSGKTKPTVDLSSVDTTDGSKIVEHVLGTDPKTAAAAVADKTGADSSLLTKLMPLLAPIVMSYLANKAFGGSTAKSGSGGLGGLLGNLLGGGATTQPAQEQSSGLGNLLGGLLGNAVGSGKSASSSGGLGSILNAIF